MVPCPTKLAGRVPRNQVSFSAVEAAGPGYAARELLMSSFVVSSAQNLRPRLIPMSHCF